MLIFNVIFFDLNHRLNEYQNVGNVKFIDSI